MNRYYVFRKTEPDLAQVKAKYFVVDKNRKIPGKIATKKVNQSKFKKPVK